MKTVTENDKAFLWTFDQVSKTVKSVQYTSRSLDVRSTNLYTYNTDSRWSQLFKYNGEEFIDSRGQAIAFKGDDRENAPCGREATNGKIHQHWTIVYQTKSKDFFTSKFNEEFGLFYNRPFHIVSELPKHRYVDIVGNKIVIKTPNGFDSQVWSFDRKSRSIVSKKNN
jgi:hypothetical protein